MSIDCLLLDIKQERDGVFIYFQWLASGFTRGPLPTLLLLTQNNHYFIFAPMEGIMPCGYEQRLLLQRVSPSW